MVRSLSPTEAHALLHEGNVDLIDVRETHEWESGHLPGARHLPLDQLRASPRTALTRDRILMVCARGVRSMTAATIAEQQGFREVYSLAGGTIAWIEAGLPTSTGPSRSDAPEARANAASGSLANSAANQPRLGVPAAAPSDTAVPEADSDADDSPELGAVFGANVHELRTQRGLSLDALARAAGVSRAVLGQLELGTSTPSIAVGWKVARALEVPFAALLARPQPIGTHLMRHAQAKRLVSTDGRFSSRSLCPPGSLGRVEFYELWLAGHGREEAEPHQPGTRENLIVVRGRLDLHVRNEQFHLDAGDAVLFSADVPHVYANPGSEECVMHLVITYAESNG